MIRAEPVVSRLPLTQRARAALAITLGHGIRALIRATGRGSGTAYPGLVASRVAPRLLTSALLGLRGGLVVVSGTSGKSTTTKLLVKILRAHGLSVFTNASTANIRQGLLSDMLSDLRLSGRMRCDIAVLEMDEAHGAKIVAEVAPSTVLLTNVGTDQIDRFNDPALVAEMLGITARAARHSVVSNGDDELLERQLESLGDVDIHRFGVSREVLAAVPHGLGNASMAAERLTTGTIVSWIDGDRSTIEHGGQTLEVNLPARGAHYAVDVAAAIAAAAAVLKEDFDSELACAAISTPDPVFGRNQIVRIRGKQVEMVLVQNPASFQLNLDYLPAGLDQVMVAVGSDVRDFSYLWPVDTTPLTRVAVASGSQAEELALQLIYHDVVVGRVDSDLGRALDEFLALPEPTSGHKTIIFTADAMRKTRRHFGLV